MRYISLLAAIFLLHSVALPSTTWYVDIQNTAGPWDGSQQSPYQFIQDGIIVASTGDTVFVASGSYFENINFLGKGITVKSESGPDRTWIDGSQIGSVVTFNSGEWINSILEGFTVTNGFHIAGGGIYCDGASPLIKGNVVWLNGADRYGSGIYCIESSAIIQNNTVSENVTFLYYGAGIYCGNLSNLIITSNIITQNWAGTFGGGIFCRRSYAVICNNIIAGNSAQSQGGGFYSKIDDPIPSILTNNTICYNSAGDIGGGIYCYSSSSPVITNTIIWGNDAPQGPQLFAEPGSVPVVTWCDIQGGWTGAGVIDANPKFSNPSNNDFHLSVSSPCIDAGDNSAPNLPNLDVDGQERIVRGNRNIQNGYPVPLTIVDIGADEYWGVLIDICPNQPSLRIK